MIYHINITINTSIFCFINNKTYFAVQTRKQEVSEKEYSELTEDEKRFYQRSLTNFAILCNLKQIVILLHTNIHFHIHQYV